MDCRTTADLIARSLSGNASSQDEGQLRGHVAACPACAELQSGLAGTWALMGRLPEIKTSAPVPVVRRPLPRFALIASAAAAAAILVVAAIAFKSTPAPVGAPQDKTPIAVQQTPAEQQREEERVQEVLTHIENEKPAPEAPVVVPPAPETVVILPQPSPEVKPTPAPVVPEPKEVVKTPVPETRPEAVTPPAPVVVAPAPLPVLATLNHLEGSVFGIVDGRRSALKSGHKLVAGDSIETSGKASQAAVEFADGTRVVLGADTIVDSIRDAGGKRVSLKQGVLAAQVAKQPAGEPMTFATATAEARVLGTRLTLSVTPTSTRLEVREGKVRITRKDDNASVDVTTEHVVVAGKGLSMTPKAAPVRVAMRETFDRPRWGGAWQQGGETNLGLKMSVENGSLSLKAAQKPAQDLAGGKMPTDAGELARKALQGVNTVASLSRKDWPRSAWLETRQAYPFSNEAPLRIRARAWNSHHDPDRLVWLALNHGVAGQGLSLERRGASLQLWVEGAAAPAWKADAAAPQEWETVELWISKDQVVVRRNEATLYKGANPLKVKAGAVSLGSNAKMELAQDEEVRFDDVDILLPARAEFDEVAR